MTRTGYMIQGMWDDERALGWFDLTEGMYPDETTAAKGLFELLSYRLSHRKNHSRVLAGTRIVKRTIVDEVCR